MMLANDRDEIVLKFVPGDFVFRMCAAPPQAVCLHVKIRSLGLHPLQAKATARNQLIVWPHVLIAQRRVSVDGFVAL